MYDNYTIRIKTKGSEMRICSQILYISENFQIKGKQGVVAQNRVATDSLVGSRICEQILPARARGGPAARVDKLLASGSREPVWPAAPPLSTTLRTFWHGQNALIFIKTLTFVHTEMSTDVSQ